MKKIREKFREKFAASFKKKGDGEQPAGIKIEQRESIFTDRSETALNNNKNN